MLYEYGVNFQYATVESGSPEENATFNVMVKAASEEEAKKLAHNQVSRPIIVGYIHRWGKVCSQ